jgi:hypothetical protein
MHEHHLPRNLQPATRAQISKVPHMDLLACSKHPPSSLISVDPDASSIAISERNLSIFPQTQPLRKRKSETKTPLFRVPWTNYGQPSNLSIFNTSQTTTELTILIAERFLTVPTVLFPKIARVQLKLDRDSYQ